MSKPNIISLFFLWVVFALAACGSSSQMGNGNMVTLGAANTANIVKKTAEVDSPALEAEAQAAQPTGTPDPMAFLFSVNSSEAFAIIEDTSPKCTTCHVISTRGNENGPGPNLNGLKDRAADAIPGLSAREYVKQSILDPSAHISENCPRGACKDMMYDEYGEKISSEQLETLVNFLLSLEADDDTS